MINLFYSYNSWPHVIAEEMMTPIVLFFIFVITEWLNEQIAFECELHIKCQQQIVYFQQSLFLRGICCLCLLFERYRV